MPALLSGSSLNTSAPSGYAKPGQLQYQLGPTPTTSTGFTLIANSSSQVTYVSSLGNVQFDHGVIYSNLPNQNIVIIATGSTNVSVIGSNPTVNSTSGAFVVEGGVGIRDNLITGEDAIFNGIQVGQGYNNTLLGGGINNIVIAGTATPTSNSFPNGQENINIGYSSLQGIGTAYKSIAIGRYAASTGTLLQNTIAIGDSALMNIGTTQTQFVGTITSATTATPVVITVDNHNLASGTLIHVNYVDGMTELNNNDYYVSVLTSSTLALYTNNILGTSLDGSTFGTYVSGGVISIDLLWNNNFAIGTNAGLNLINGTENFFLGYNITPSFTTGSYNFFLGHEIGLNMTNGNSNISIGGDNLVDGVSNQVNIGSVFYYNGAGYLQLNADTGLGLGDTATNTVLTASVSAISLGTQTLITTTAPHGFANGSYVTISELVGATGLNNQSYYVRVPANNEVVLYLDEGLTSPLDSTGYGSYVRNGTLAVNNIVGALTVFGGLGVTDNAIIAGPVKILNYVESTSTSSGSLIINGGLAVAGNVYVGGTLHASITGAAAQTSNLNGGSAGSLVYQQATSSTTFLNIGPTNSVLQSNGSVPLWTNTLTVENIVVTGTDTSTSTTTGAVTVTGGVGIQGSVYSADGNPTQNYLLYTPKVTVSATGIPPSNPNIGDFWIDTIAGGELQFIQDGTSTFWIQITSI